MFDAAEFAEERIQSYFGGVSSLLFKLVIKSTLGYSNSS